MKTIFDIVVESIKEELESQIKQQQDEIIISQNFKGAMESRYDTFKEEAQERCIILGKRIKQLEEALSTCYYAKDNKQSNIFKFFKLAGSNTMSVILSPVSARDYKDIKIISVNSPLGKALLTASIGDTLKIGSNLFSVRIIKDTIPNEQIYQSLIYTIQEMKLKYLRLTITKNCPASCPFCHHEGFENLYGKKLTSFEYENIADTFHSIFKRVKLTGGEPLSCPDIYKIANIFKIRNYQLSLTTNGFLLNDEQIRKIKETKFHTVAVSFPSFDKNTYKKYFGIKSNNIQKKVIENIKKLPSVVDRVKINMVVGDKDLFEKEFDLFLNLSQDYNIEINPFRIHSDKTDEKEFHQYIINKFKLNFIKEGFKNNKYHTKTGAKVSLSHELYDNAAKTKCNNICKTCSNYTKCIEGAYALRIDEIGNIKPCLQNPIFGNIREII